MTITSKYSTLQSPRKEGGFTLVELMVGVVISAFMMLAVTTIMTNSRKNFDVTDGMTRMQENARFVMHYLGNDIRMAGYYGCRTSEVSLKSDDNPVEAESSTAAGNEPGTAKGDIITVRYFTPPVETWTASRSDDSDESDSLNGETTLVVPEQMGQRIAQQLDLANEYPCGAEPSPTCVQKPRIYPVDCNSVRPDGYEISQAYPDGTINLAEPIDIEGPEIEVGMEISGAPPEITYSIDWPEDGRKLPVLYRNGSELAEGVEYMRFLFGVDSKTDNDNLPDAFVPWEQVDPNNDVIMSVQVGLLINSINISNHQNDDSTGQHAALKSAKTDYQILDVNTDDNFDLATDANVARRVFTQTFQVRNNEQHK